MGTVITLTVGATNLATITGAEVNAGPVYDKLVGWYDLPEVELDLQKRENASGAYAPGQTFPDEAVISIEGQVYGGTRGGALAARENLLACYNDGLPVTMTVADDLRTTSREVYIKSVKIPWTIHPEFNYTIDASAPDPRRYTATVRVGTGLAVAGSGLDWSAPGLDWGVDGLDWGTAAMDGRAIVTNAGNTATVSRYTISGGTMPDGFALVNVNTGERLTYLGPVLSGTTVTLDTMARTAFINGSAPGGRFLPSPQWWAVPAKSTRSIQFVALGATTGSPRIDIDTASAYY